MNRLGLFLCTVSLVITLGHSWWKTDEDGTCEEREKICGKLTSVHCSVGIATGKQPCCHDERTRMKIWNCKYTCFGRIGKCLNNGICAGRNKCVCPEGGFDHQCADVNECFNGECHQLCNNTVGSYSCDCLPGYILDTDNKTCTDVNECVNLNGGCHQLCNNTLGSYNCDCLSGYILDTDNITCTDIDECAISTGACDQLCVNEIGGYKCSCPAGYSLDADNYTCSDIDECSLKNGPCEAVCDNLIGSFQCFCEKGYQLNEDGVSCKPICDSDCPHGGHCERPGWCSCNEGFYPPDCEDTDECALEGSCDQTCFNDVGSYRCECETGYILLDDKRTCADKDECRGPHQCTDICVNVEGTYRCQCSSGFELNQESLTCVDINECVRAESGCDQICHNTEGSFECDCKDGFLLNAGNKKCMEFLECADDHQTGCLNRCIPESDGSCRCLPGQTLHPGSKYCLEPCWNNPCLHRGLCVPDSVTNVSYCNCSATGFTGRNCEIGRLEIPKSVTVSYLVIHKGIFVTAFADEDVVIWAQSSHNITVFPNPITILRANPTTEIRLFTHNTGNLKVTFNITQGNLEQKLYTMSVRSEDVFRRLKLEAKTVPKGCFHLNLRVRDVVHTFTSTSPWYRQRMESRVHFTSGVTHYRYPKVDIPLAVDGLRVIYGTSLHISNRKTPISSSDIQHHDPMDKGCKELVLTSIDFADFDRASSLLRSVFRAVDSHIPFWLTFDVASVGDESHGRPRPKAMYRADIQTGKQIQEHRDCYDFLPVRSENDTYVTVRFTESTIVTKIGMEFYVPHTPMHSPNCLVIDFRRMQSFVVVYKSNTSGIFEAVPFAKDKIAKKGIALYPRSFGFSNGWYLRKFYEDDLIFFNGAEMFNYRFPEIMRFHGLVEITGKLPSVGESDISIRTTASVLSDRDPEKILTHLFTKPIDLFLHLNSLELTIGLTILGKRQELVFDNILYGDRVVIASGGELERKICGHRSNPPGVFAQVHLLSTLSYPLGYIGVLEIFSSSAQAYFFETFDDRNGSKSGWDKTTVDSLMEVLRLRVRMLRKVLHKLSGPSDPEWKNSSINVIDKTLDKLDHRVTGFDTTRINATYFGDLSMNLSTLAYQLNDQVIALINKADLNFDQDFLGKTELLSRTLSLVKGSVKNVWFEMFDGSVPYDPKIPSWGLKIPVSLYFLKLYIEITGTFIMSSENLLGCSGLSKYYDHINGGNAQRYVGEIQTLKPSEYLKAGLTISLLWKFICIVPGGSVEVAISETKPIFVIRIEVSWSWLFINMRNQLYISNKEVVTTAEGNLWDIFRARITLGAAIPRTWTDLVLWLKGEFLPGGDNSLESSFWEAAIRVIQTDAKNVDRRLRTITQNLNIHQELVSKAERRVHQAKHKLDSGQTNFDKAIKRLEDSKEKLEQAKKSFKNTAEDLEREQSKVEKLCKLQNCKKCVTTVEYKNCVTKGRTSCAGYKRCSISFASFKCAIKNIGCKTVRKLCYVGLSSGKVGVSALMLSLDACKAAVSVSQIIVDKSRYQLGVVKGLYLTAQTFLHSVSEILRKTKQALDLLNKGLQKVYQLAASVSANTLKKFFDVRKCGFKQELSFVNVFKLDAYCEINYNSRGWKKYFFDLNARDTSGSIFGLAQSAVKTAKEKYLDKRTRRSFIDSEAESGNTTHSESSNYIPVETWDSRCKSFRGVEYYLNKSIEVLMTLTKEIIDDVEELETEIMAKEYINSTLGNLSFDDINLNGDVARVEFNLSREDLEKALNEIKVHDDSYILETNKFENAVIEQSQSAIDFVRSSQVSLEWSLHMVEVDYFGDCMNFPDCVVWSFGKLRSLMDTVDPNLVSNLHTDLRDLESHFDSVIDNASLTASDIVGIGFNFGVLRDLSQVFCGADPVMVNTPSNTTAFIGQSLDIRCVAEGTAPLNYYWFKADRLLLEGTNQTTLQLQNITEADDGSYSCIAGDHRVNTSSYTFLLRVVQAPTILSRLPSSVYMLGITNRSLVADVSGIPKPRIVWNCCSSKECMSLTIDKLYDFLGESVGSEFLCRYRATNEFGEVTSTETHVILSEIHPACPSRVLHWAYNMNELEGSNVTNVTGTNSTNSSIISDWITDEHGKTSNFHSNWINNDTKLAARLSTALVGVLDNRYIDLELDNLSVDITTHDVTMRLTASCSSLSWKHNSGNSLEDISVSFGKMISRLQENFEEGIELFSVSHTSYMVNPAYFSLEESQWDCPNDWELWQKQYCVKEPARFILHPPSHLSSAVTVDSVRLSWQHPFYASYLHIKYSVIVTPQGKDENLDYINESTVVSNMTLPSASCGVRCTVSVRAVSETQQSVWITKDIESTNDSVTVESTAVAWIWIVVTLVLLFLAFVLLGAYMKTRSTRKIAAIMDHSFMEPTRDLTITPSVTAPVLDKPIRPIR